VYGRHFKAGIHLFPDPNELSVFFEVGQTIGKESVCHAAKVSNAYAGQRTVPADKFKDTFNLNSCPHTYCIFEIRLDFGC
jgi:hypothetical protein